MSQGSDSSRKLRLIWAPALSSCRLRYASVQLRLRARNACDKLRSAPVSSGSRQLRLPHGPRKQQPFMPPLVPAFSCQLRLQPAPAPVVSALAFARLRIISCTHACDPFLGVSLHQRSCLRCIEQVADIFQKQLTL